MAAQPRLFDPPDAPLSRVAFAARSARHGLVLDRRTQLLFDATHLFINGAALAFPATGTPALKALANARALASQEVAGLPAATGTILYNWYRDGYLHTGADG